MCSFLSVVIFRIYTENACKDQKMHVEYFCHSAISSKGDKVCNFICSSFNALLNLGFFQRLWLVGCFGFNGPLRQYFSLYRAVSQREGERGERIDESKNVQSTPTRTYYKRNRPLPYCYQNCRTPRDWKFTQHHRTTRPPSQRLWFVPIRTKYFLLGLSL